MKCVGVETLLHALDGGEKPASRPNRFTPHTDRIGNWGCPRDGLDEVVKKGTYIPVGNRTSILWSSSPNLVAILSCRHVALQWDLSL
jgi:hypothetical protein